MIKAIPILWMPAFLIRRRIGRAHNAIAQGEVAQLKRVEQGIVFYILGLLALIAVLEMHAKLGVLWQPVGRGFP